MTTPPSFIVRIDVPEFKGVWLTGFIVSSKHIITCAHAGVPPKEPRQALSIETIRGLERLGVVIRFDDGSQATGTIVEYASPDCALVRVDRLIHRKPVRLVANLRAKHLDSIIRRRPIAVGFSDQAPDELTRAPFNEIVSASESLERADLFDYQTIGGLHMGMSGGPALIQAAEEWLCIGMVYLGGAGAATSRLVSSQTILDFLKSCGVNCLPPADADDYFRAQLGGFAAWAEDYRRRFIRYVTFAGRFADSDDPISLPDVYVNRTEEERGIMKRISHGNSGSEGTWISIQGHAGAGKSSLLWYLHDVLSKRQGVVVQPFAAQDITNDFTKEEAVVSYHLEGSPESICVVLIDTLDLIVGREDRALASFLSGLRSQGAFVITTCRPLEVQRLVPLHEPDHTIKLERYSNEESKIAISKYVAQAYPRLTPEQKKDQEKELWNLLDSRRKFQELSWEPLILRMIFETYPPDPVPAEINTARIHSEYWQRCVVTDRLHKSDSDAERLRQLVACRLADAILFSGETSFSDSIRLSEFEIAWRALDEQRPFPGRTIESLQSSRVIEPSGIDAVRFFHQTLLEFAAARHILRSTHSLQQHRLDSILADLTSGIFVRAPVLVQIAVQDAYARGNTWTVVLDRLLGVGSESACYLTLEILGKIPETPLTKQTLEKSGIVDRWKKEHPDRLAECAVEAISYYPKTRIPFGLTILESVLDRVAPNTIFALAERFASLDAKAVLEFLRRTLTFVTDRNSVQDDARGHYKTALLACADSGEPDAVRILGDVFWYLTEGQRQGLLGAVAKKVNPQTSEAVGDFLRSVQNVLRGGKVNQVIENYLTALSQLHQIAPCCGESIANELLQGDSPPNLDDAAMLRGWINARILKTFETIPTALDDIFSQGHLKRLTSATILGFSEPSDQDAIVARFLSVDLSQLTDSVRSSLFSVVGDLEHASPALVMKFISDCSWPENLAGKAWRKISAQLAAVSPDSFKIWLLARIRGHRITRMIAVGINQLILASPGILTRHEFSTVFETMFKSDIHCLRAFAGAAGAIATVNPDGASDMVRQLVLPCNRDVLATLAYSLHTALAKNSRWVSTTVPLLIEAALSRKDDGTISKLLEGLRKWPEEGRLELTRLLEENFTQDVLQAFPQEKCQVEFLLLVKMVAKNTPDRAFGLLRRTVIETDGAAGAAASTAANIAAHTEDREMLNGLLMELLHASSKGRQPAARNAIYHGLRAIDEQLGSRYVIKRFFEMYRTVTDPDSLKPLIRSVSNLSSWTQVDTDALLGDLEHIKGSVRAYVMKLK